VVEQVSPLPQHREPQVPVPAGQPHVPLVGLTQATPASQQAGPHGVFPAGHVAASPRNGLSTVAATPPASATPIIRIIPRRGIGFASPRDNSSNRSLMCPPTAAAAL
jgi:hypothetical protein